jgi:hypothetical protein
LPPPPEANSNSFDTTPSPTVSANVFVERLDEIEPLKVAVVVEGVEGGAGACVAPPTRKTLVATFQ